MLIRDIDGADLEAVCDLVDADRLSGQPPCRVDKVQNALAGRAEIDVLYWQKLRELRSLVATSKRSNERLTPLRLAARGRTTTVPRPRNTFPGVTSL